MFNLMTQNWWAMALRGFAAVLFGIAAFMRPGITLWVLAPLFGAYALFNGVFAVIEAFSRDVSRERWWALLFEGVVSIVVGASISLAGADRHEAALPYRVLGDYDRRVRNYHCHQVAPRNQR